MLMMLTLKIMSVHDWFHLRKAKFMFKVYNNLTQQYISDHFNSIRKVSCFIEKKVLKTSEGKWYFWGWKQCFRYTCKYHFLIFVTRLWPLMYISGCLFVILFPLNILRINRLNFTKFSICIDIDKIYM